MLMVGVLLIELLQLFTASEELEGNIYTCVQCGGK